MQLISHAVLSEGSRALVNQTLSRKVDQLQTVCFSMGGAKREGAMLAVVDLQSISSVANKTRGILLTLISGFG